MKLHRTYLQFFIFFLAFLTLSALSADAAPHLETVRISGGSVPIAENLSLETYMDVSVSGALSAVDADDTEFLYAMVTGPKKGTVVLQEDGTFLYTPRENRRGRDTFSFTATDIMGNISNVAQVTIRIRKPASAVSYADTAGTPAAYGAQYLAEEGLYTGHHFGDTWLFSPERTITQGEFLVLSMALTETPAAEAADVTGYANDSDIPLWLKPYLSAAVVNAVPAGTWEDAPVFNWDAPITDREAALLLDALMNLTDVACSGDTAEQAEANLEACRIMTFAEQERILTWGDAAQILASAGVFLENRQS